MANQEKTGYAPLIADELQTPNNAVSPPNYPYPVQQQTTQNDATVVIQQQPTYTVSSVSPPYDMGPSNLVLPWVATCVVFLICAWCSLPCTITAIVLSIYAHISARKGDVDIAKKTERISVVLSVTGLLVAVLIWVIYIITFFVDDDDREEAEGDDDDHDDD